MEKTATEFRYQDYFNLHMADKADREEVVAALNELASVPEGLEKIQQAVALHGRIEIYATTSAPAGVTDNMLFVSLDDIHNSYYKDAQGNKHSATTLRVLSHEIFHLGDDALPEYLRETEARRNELVEEGRELARAGYDEEKVKRTQQYLDVIKHPEAYSREEGMEAVRRLQAMKNKESYIEGKGIMHYQDSPEYAERRERFEEPAVVFANGIMHNIRGEAPRVNYKEGYTKWDYSMLHLAGWRSIDGLSLPVNPEPAKGATCGIPGDILEKINRGEMTLAQAGIVLDSDETLPDEHEGCLVVAPWTPSPSQAESKEPKR